jgi:hypothetical protein
VNVFAEGDARLHSLASETRFNAKNGQFQHFALLLHLNIVE